MMLCAVWYWITDPDHLTAISTTGIFAFTIVLAGVGWCQAHLIGKSIDLANKEYIASHPPKLILRQAWSLITDPDKSTIVVNYTLTNVGGSKCWITECHLGVEFIDFHGYPKFIQTPEKIFPNRVPHIGSIEAGEPKDLLFSDTTMRWTAGVRQNFVQPDVGVHFAGYVRYTDEPKSGIVRTTAFRWKYDVDSQRFRPIWKQGENEHEYA